MKRKSHFKNKRSLIICLSLIISTALSSQTYERSKHIYKAFPVAPTTEIQISNKYGNIHIATWEKDSVAFEIDVLVKANKQSKADKIYDYIDFEFTSNEYYVIAKTLFENYKSNVWSEITDIAKIIFSSDNKAQIDYKVYLPASNPLEISNKFGNIYTTDHTHDIKINLSNGDLKAHAFYGRTKINLEFGNASVKSVSEATLEINYAQFNAETADKVTLRSKSSEIHIDDVKDLDINSRRDKLYLKKAGKINGEVSFTYLNINSLSELIVVSASYGEINIDQFLPGFQLMSVNSNYTDYTLVLPDNQNIDLEINHDSKTEINYPNTFENLKKKTKNAEEETYITYGFIGEPSDDALRIDIDTKSGKITIL